MEVAEAEARLQQLLKQAGFAFDRPDPKLAWSVFKAFVREPVSCSDDGVFFECGVYNFSCDGGERFHFNFVRHFTVDVDDEYDHTETLYCTFTCQPSPEMKALKTELSLQRFRRDYEAYFAAVENKPEFQQGLKFTGWKCEVFQERV